MLPFAFEFICPFLQFQKEQLFALDAFPHDVKFPQCLLLFGVELGDTGDFIDDLPALEITHLHDSGDVTLHHDVIPMGFDAML